MNIESYLKEQLSLFKDNKISLNGFKTHISKFIVKDSSNASTINNAIDKVVDKYSKNELSDENLIQALISIDNRYSKVDNTNNGTRPITRSNSGVTSVTDTTIVDVDTDIIDALAKEYGIIENDILANTITVPRSVSEVGTSIQITVSGGNSTLTTEVNNVKSEMTETIQALMQVDNSIPKADYLNFTFNQLTAAAQKLKMNKLVPADINFFKNNPDCKINGDVVTFTNKNDGNTYTYNVANKTFTCNGSRINNFGIYVPYGSTDYSKLNTFTYFVQGDYDRTTSYPSNAIVLRVIKNEVGNLHFNKQTEVAGATKFINNVANTDLTNCQNIIAGDSVYGAHSLKLAASNGNLYNTVYCVNNAALVTGVNAQKGEKEQFSSTEQLKGLNGKNIYFISATGDPNLACHYGNKGALTPCAYRDSYTYTGVELLTKVCPDAKIYGVYGGSKAKPGIKTLYRNLSDKSNNFTYLENGWSNFSKREANTHTDGAKMMSDLVAAVPTNVNGYSV